MRKIEAPQVIETPFPEKYIILKISNTKRKT